MPYNNTGGIPVIEVCVVGGKLFAVSETTQRKAELTIQFRVVELDADTIVVKTTVYGRGSCCRCGNLFGILSYSVERNRLLRLPEDEAELPRPPESVSGSDQDRRAAAAAAAAGGCSCIS
jgi:hypothetical protein